MVFGPSALNLRVCNFKRVCPGPVLLQDCRRVLVIRNQRRLSVYILANNGVLLGWGQLSVGLAKLIFFLLSLL